MLFDLSMQMCILLASSLVLETSGNLEKGYFSVDVGVGLKENGDTSFSFPMLIVFTSFHIIIMNRIFHLLLLWFLMSLVQHVKSEHNYYFISSYQTVIILLIQLCMIQFHVLLICALFVLFSQLLLFSASRDICPTSISEQGKCCDIHHQGLCLYDSTIQFNTVFPYLIFHSCLLELLVVL